jgi:peptidoglycan hydrolase FlgJ
MSLTNQQQVAGDVAADAAVRVEQKTGLPARLIMAQWAVESGWGRYQPGYNCFGIKHYPGAWGVQRLRTHEWHGKDVVEDQDFAVFKRLDDCFEYYAELLTRPGGIYSNAWEKFKHTQDLPKFIEEIAPLYATDPHYASKVIIMLKYPDLIHAIVEAYKRGTDEKVKEA